MKYTVIYIFIAVTVVVALAYFLMSNNLSCKNKNDQCTTTQDCCSGLMCNNNVCDKDYASDYNKITGKFCFPNLGKPLVDVTNMSDPEKIEAAAKVCTNCRTNPNPSVECVTDLFDLTKRCRAFRFEDGKPYTCIGDPVSPTDPTKATDIYSLSS